jgi:hypothetical protein
MCSPVFPLAFDRVDLGALRDEQLANRREAVLRGDVYRPVAVPRVLAVGALGVRHQRRELAKRLVPTDRAVDLLGFVFRQRARVHGGRLRAAFPRL